MEYPRLNPSQGQCVRTAILVAAFSAAFVLPALSAMPASAATLERVQQAGKLVLGYRADARPFSYQDDAGNPDGYAIAVCKQVADKIKSELALSSLNVEWVPVTTSDQFQALQEGKIDLLCGAAETLSARKDVDFSVPVFVGGVGALLRTDAPLGLRDALAGRPYSGPLWRGSPAQVLQQQVFSVVAGSPTEKWLEGRLNKFQIASRVVPVDGYEAGIQRVLDRTSNVFFADRSILLDAAARNPSASNLRVLDRQFTFAPYALVLERGDADFRLIVDRALGQVFATEEFHNAYVKWFGEPDERAEIFFKLSALPE